MFGLTVIEVFVEPLSHKYDKVPLPLVGIAVRVAVAPLHIV